MRALTTHTILSSFLFSGLVACGDDGPGNPVDIDAAPPAIDAPLGLAGGPCSDTFCSNAIMADLSLHGDRTSQGDVTNVDDNGDWVSTIDATAGGIAMAPENAFLYMKFTPNGLEKVDIDDYTALESPDWDIAARRYVLRLNGGTSGSSCVGAAAVAGMTYEEVVDVPVGTAYQYDTFYDGGDCGTLIDDGSGQPNSPLVVMGGWWGYTTCVTTTDVPYLIELDDGSVVKLVVEAYYGTGQTECNTNGTAGTDSAMLTARWQFLQQ